MKTNIIWGMKKLLAGLCYVDAEKVTQIVLQEYDVGTAKLDALEQIDLKAEPSKALYQQVQAAFLLHGSSLSKWTTANKVAREKVRVCLVHPSKSTAVLALRNRIVIASGAPKFFPMNSPTLKPITSIACVNSFKKDRSKLGNDEEVRDYIVSLPHLTQVEIKEAIENTFGNERTPSTSALNRYLMKQRKEIESNKPITLEGTLS